MFFLKRTFVLKQAHISSFDEMKFSKVLGNRFVQYCRSDCLPFFEPTLARPTAQINSRPILI